MEHFGSNIVRTMNLSSNLMSNERYVAMHKHRMVHWNFCVDCIY